jgi:tRNA dimethylallyltransferase
VTQDIHLLPRMPFVDSMAADLIAMNKKPHLVVLVGPTGVGKTEISLSLASRLSAEIISADSRLFYRGMNIGTAKPAPEDRARVRHHLIDVADPDHTLSLADFQQLAREAIAGIQARANLPMLVGGTGQYVRAVTEGWQPPSVTAHDTLRRQLEALSRDRGAQWLHDGLGTMDPEAASKIDARNSRRTIRALEVIFATGRKFSEQRKQVDSPYHVVAIGLKRPRKQLYDRIDARIESMFESGLVEEVRALLSKGYSPDLPAMSAIGYREAVSVARGELDIDEARKQIKRLTRAFVRRQANWFKESDPNIEWFDAADPGAVATIEGFVRRAIAAL